MGVRVGGQTARWHQREQKNKLWPLLLLKHLDVFELIVFLLLVFFISLLFREKNPTLMIL